MKNSKLHYYLAQLSANEWKRLLEFAPNPYYAKDGTAARFLPVYRAEFKAAAPHPPTRESVFAGLYPDKSFNPGLFRVIQSRTMDLFREFIVQEYLQSETRLKDRIFLKELNRRQWKKYFRKTHQTLLKALDQQPQDEFYYQERIELDQAFFTYMSEQPRRSGERGLKELVHSLDNYYIITRLALACLAANQQRVLPTSPETDEIGRWIEALEKRSFIKTTLARIYYHIYHTLTAKPEIAITHYEPLKSLLFTHGGRFRKEVAYQLFTFLTNFCSQRIRAGEERFEGEAAQCYRHMLESGIMLVEGKLAPSQYKNIVKLFVREATRSGDFQQVERLVEQYGQQLSDSGEGFYLEHARAEVLFAKGDFLATAISLTRIWRQFKDEYFRLDARGMLLFCLFELEGETNWERWQEEHGLSSFEKEWNAFRMYLERNREIPPGHKKVYKVFCESMRQLMTASGKPYREMKALLDPLQHRLEAATGTPLRHALLGAIRRLLK